MIIEPRAFLRSLFDAAVAAADPAAIVRAHLPQPPRGRTIVVGAGKAAAAMAQAFERSWPGRVEGLVVTRDGHEAPCVQIEVALASHPVPDERGARAAARILELVSGAGTDDLVVALVSGGGSALLTLPCRGLTLGRKREVNTVLLRSGAPIEAMNCVRKHLSAIKGGRLAAAAAPARLVTLLISDVPGDDPSVIASGPTVPDPSTSAEAAAILARYGIEDVDGLLSETPKPHDPCFTGNEVRVVAAPQQSLEAAAALARSAGLTPLILGDAIEGEAREVGTVLAGIARQVIRHDQPAAAPCVLLSGGETTVTVRGRGRGGRNVELALAMAVALNGEARVWAIAADTDGIDGAEEVAGALVTPDTLARGRAVELDARSALERNDAHPYFARLGDAVITGPTLTNVNDFRAVLITAA